MTDPKTGSVRYKGHSNGSPGDGASVSGAFWGRKVLLLGEHTCWFRQIKQQKVTAPRTSGTQRWKAQSQV